MRWEGRRESSNVEDRRRGGRRMVIGGGAGTLVLALIVWFLGGDPTALLQNDANSTFPGTTTTDDAGQPQDELGRFVSVVLADTEDVWRDLFQQRGHKYRDPRLVLFHGQAQSACGFASTATGPFYCPSDERVYIDLRFYEDLKRRFSAPGDFAQAYVIAHEVGHHVQNLLGTLDRVHSQRSRLSETEYNRLSVRLELQADFYAGVWAHHAQRTKQIIEAGDLEEALRAAAAIGDDRLQMQSRGYVVPESFAHGTSQQRLYWFRQGYDTGDLSHGDTFNSPEP